MSVWTAGRPSVVGGSRGLGLSIVEQDFLSQLHKRGEELIRRSPSREDRRVTHVALTRRGPERLQRSRDLLESRVLSNFGRMLTQGELDSLQQILKKVLVAHGRWKGQMAYLRGEGVHPGP